MSKQVDFYLISNQVNDAKYKLASRLANKLQRLNQKTLIVTNDSDASDQLDQLMWSFSGTSFVAHERLQGKVSNESDTEKCAIHIAESKLVDNDVLDQQYSVMINLTEAVPLFNHHFSRIAEIVEQDDTAKQQGRQRFKDYKTEGFELKTHQIEL